MKHFCRFAAALLVGLVLSGTGLACQPRPARPAAPAPVPTPAPLLLQFERTACYGPCPVDVLRVYADGRLHYAGRDHAPRQGQYAGQLSPPEQAALVEAFEAARFFDFAPAYTSRASDLPTYYLTYSQAGRTHKVKDYDNAPAALNELETRLEALIDAPRWHPQ